MQSFFMLMEWNLQSLTYTLINKVINKYAEPIVSIIDFHIPFPAVSRTSYD